MGIFDFLFGKKKAENKSVNQQTECKAVNQTQKMDMHMSESNLSIVPFTFVSNQHQRYESGNPVQGLQVCQRTIRVEKNVSGCSGYQLAPGDGYIVRMINGDTGKPQMSAKPMRVIKSTPSEIVLRGYKVNAMTPFGYQEIDMGDYGLTVVKIDGQISKCTLHMYDRNIDIEYCRRPVQHNDTSINNAEKQEDALPENIKKIISLANNGMICFARQDMQGEWRYLAEMYNIVQSASGQLLDIPSKECKNVGSAFSLLLSHDPIRSNEDVLRAVTDYTYYLLSKAIEYSPSSILYQMRTSLVADCRKFFYYTVANALNIPDSDPFDMLMSSPLIVRTNDYIYAMGKYDFEHAHFDSYDGNIAQFHNLCPNTDKTAEDGKEYIDATVKYLTETFAKYRK